MDAAAELTRERLASIIMVIYFMDAAINGVVSSRRFDLPGGMGIEIEKAKHVAYVAEST